MLAAFPTVAITRCFGGLTRVMRSRVPSPSVGVILDFVLTVTARALVSTWSGPSCTGARRVALVSLSPEFRGEVLFSRSGDPGPAPPPRLGPRLRPRPPFPYRGSTRLAGGALVDARLARYERIMNPG
jgi:hypothetical protein